MLILCRASEDARIEGIEIERGQERIVLQEYQHTLEINKARNGILDRLIVPKRNFELFERTQESLYPETIFERERSFGNRYTLEKALNNSLKALAWKVQFSFPDLNIVRGQMLLYFAIALDRFCFTIVTHDPGDFYYRHFNREEESKLLSASCKGVIIPRPKPIWQSQI
jgi:hypothetical protein